MTRVHLRARSRIIICFNPHFTSANGRGTFASPTFREIQPQMNTLRALAKSAIASAGERLDWRSGSLRRSPSGAISEPAAEIPRISSPRCRPSF